MALLLNGNDIAEVLGNVDFNGIQPDTVTFNGRIVWSTRILVVDADALKFNTNGNQFAFTLNGYVSGQTWSVTGATVSITGGGTSGFLTVTGVQDDIANPVIFSHDTSHLGQNIVFDQTKKSIVDVAYDAVNKNTIASFCKGQTNLTEAIVEDAQNAASALEAFMDCSFLTSFILRNSYATQIFDRMLMNCTALKCIHALETTGVTSAVDMFTNTPSLISPGAVNQTNLMNGALWYTNECADNGLVEGVMDIIASDPAHGIPQGVNVINICMTGAGSPGDLDGFSTDVGGYQGDYHSQQIIVDTVQTVNVGIGVSSHTDGQPGGSTSFGSLSVNGGAPANEFKGNGEQYAPTCGADALNGGVGYYAGTRAGNVFGGYKYGGQPGAFGNGGNGNGGDCAPNSGAGGGGNGGRSGSGRVRYTYGYPPPATAVLSSTEGMTRLSELV